MVGALVGVVQPDHRTIGAGRGFSLDVVGGRLDPDYVLAGPQVDPLNEGRELPRVVLQLESTPDLVIR